MAGIYIHIPFCKKACHYCNFHFSTSLHRKSEFLKALHAEIKLSDQFHPYLIKQPIETIYLGGGTPSILSPQELEDIMNALFQQFTINQQAEITLEANPDDIDRKNLNHWKSLGINRLSIGIQSFFEDDLKWMNRAHHAHQALDCIHLAQKAAFDNLNIDLIYGTPTLNDTGWLKNLDTAAKLGITHLSCYALTVEEKTALSHFVQRGKISAPSEQQQAVHFEILQAWAVEHGWEHYEISNLCLPGFRSQHNSNYWKGLPYAGFGPSAHSFDGKNLRMIGIANNALYISSWLENLGGQYETEILTGKHILNEKIMTGLRLQEGIPINPDERAIFELEISEKDWKKWVKTVRKWEISAHITLKAGRLFLTQKGRLFADAIASELFF